MCSEPKEKKDNGRIHFRCRREDKQGVCEDKAEQACSSGVGHKSSTEFDPQRGWGWPIIII